jgi:hypothetical protein
MYTQCNIPTLGFSYRYKTEHLGTSHYETRVISAVTTS